MIAINWGSSNFRAYKLDAQGNVEDEKGSGRGAVGVQAGGFLDALFEEIGDWHFEGDASILMCGMAGARPRMEGGSLCSGTGDLRTGSRRSHPD